ncbi:hypothetical protein RYX36_015407, partial [Vicia faba]
GASLLAVHRHLNLLRPNNEVNPLSTSRYRIFQPTTTSFSPFFLFNQKQWKKPVISAQTRLEDRVRITRKMKELILLEDVVSKRRELLDCYEVKKLLNGTLHVHALRLMRRELGLPCDFRDFILWRYIDEFRLVDLEIMALVDWDDELGKARVEE